MATKENKWQGRNITRWRNEEYDTAVRAAEDELDPVKRAALFIKMNDLMWQRHGGDPGRRTALKCGLANKLRPATAAAGTTTSGSFSDWYREA